MAPSKLLKISAVVLFVLGLIMGYLGLKGNMAPPVITGLGFIIIAVVFINMSKAK